jgi:predicted 3-demethylubiquinone-9 3-methyltransferase (glyoxalase superfamily)
MSSLKTNQNIIPFLWFDNRAEEAMNFYTGIFPNSEITLLKHWGEGLPFGADKVMLGQIIINGLQVHLFDAGPQFKFSEAFSFFVLCKTQQEIDTYWEKLTAGGNESQCGWLKDKFGFSWQIVPEMLEDRLANGEPAKVAQMMQALWQMKKLNIAELDTAYNK